MIRKLTTVSLISLSLTVTPALAEDGKPAIFICDLRHVFGTCNEYDPETLDADAEKAYRDSCTKNQYGDKKGKYVEGRHCPEARRVGACLGVETMQNGRLLGVNMTSITTTVPAKIIRGLQRVFQIPAKAPAKSW